jgi:hypothetical protein
VLQGRGNGQLEKKRQCVSSDSDSQVKRHVRGLFDSMRHQRCSLSSSTVVSE